MQNKKEKFYLIEKNSLPEIYIKVMQVKEGIKNKTYPSVNQAVKELGISRSAYYKYRNSIFSYHGTDFDAVDVFNLIVEIDLISVTKLLRIFEKSSVKMMSFQQSPVMKGISSIQIICRELMKDNIDNLMTKLKKENGVIQITHQAICD